MNKTLLLLSSLTVHCSYRLKFLITCGMATLFLASFHSRLPKV